MKRTQDKRDTVGLERHGVYISSSAMSSKSLGYAKLEAEIHIMYGIDADRAIIA